MFCKWCGGTLTPSEAKCKRCGRETGALSDCGGFYDLVPTAKTSHPKKGPVPEPKTETLVPKQKKTGRLQRCTSGIAMLCCLVVLLIQLLVIGICAVRQTQEMKLMLEILQEIAGSIQQSGQEEKNPPETTLVLDSPSEPSAATEPSAAP